MATDKRKTALWAITPNGFDLAAQLGAALATADIFASARLDVATGTAEKFDRLRDCVWQQFDRYERHVFFMSTGIVIRMIASLIRHKTVDPAVVGVDDRGRFAVSLLSGHIGGANAFCEKVADVLHATAVISTATDVNAKPAIDLIAIANQLTIENPDAIRGVNMALLTGDRLPIYDPHQLLGDALSQVPTQILVQPPQTEKPAVYVDDRNWEPPPQTLVLRPRSLVAGIGCNRGTPAVEILDLLHQVMRDHGLAASSLAAVASIDIKADEDGLLESADQLEVPIEFFDRQQLDGVDRIQTPSAMVAKHVGVASVCEAAAILAARQGRLIVAKQKTRNVTVAIARMGYLSSGLDRAATTTSRSVP